ncbi:MAG: glycosyl transferase [Desulfobacterales bacterium GWB2_56_26]|nr:MAG: glycosyl transferase [Desulfobacterales bacterium GWB2_56_26]
MKSAAMPAVSDQSFSRDPMKNRPLETAVLIPCYNEEATVARVVDDFRRHLPDARIFVYDNNSTDRTVERAMAAGAIVRFEPLQGKGNVIRRMFADIEADVYVMVDGDATYDAGTAPGMIRLLIDHQLDMVNGARVTDIKEAYRPGHRFGNRMLTGIVAWTFGNRLKDMLSGYRVFSRRYVKSFPSLSSGFETETELTVHALHLRMPVAEIATAYKDRPAGSSSKLSTYKDGIRILWRILNFVKEERPMAFFSIVAVFFGLSSVGLMAPILKEFIETGLVPRVPTAVLSMSMMIIGFLSFACGLILDTVTQGRSEMKRMRYLDTPAISTSSIPASPPFREMVEAGSIPLRPAANCISLAPVIGSPAMQQGMPAPEEKGAGGYLSAA